MDAGLSTIELTGRQRLLRRKGIIAGAAVALVVGVGAVTYRGRTPAGCVQAVPVLAFLTVVAAFSLAVVGVVALEIRTTLARADVAGFRSGPMAALVSWTHLAAVGLLALAAVWAAPGLLWPASSSWHDGACRPTALGLTGGATAVGGFVAILATLDVAVLALRAHRWITRARRGVPAKGVTAGQQPSGTVICCSGGGIRSAAFCLGGLQRMSSHGRHIYQDADAVVAVSGGGYIAAAFQALWRQPSPRQPAGDGVGAQVKPVFALDSPEMHRLRRETKYLVSSPARRLQLAFSLLLGIAINIGLTLAALRPLAWVLGWVLSEAGVARLGTTADVSWPTGRHGAIGLYAGLAMMVLSPVVYLVARIVENARRFHGQWSGNRRSWGLAAPDRVARMVGWCDVVAGWLLAIGLGWALLWPGVPLTAAATARLSGFFQHRFDGSNPFGFVALSNPATFIPVAVAFIGLVGGALKGQRSDGLVESGGRAGFGQILRLFVVPWVGAALVLGSGYLLFAHWTSGYSMDPAADAWVKRSFVAIVLLRVFTNANLTTLYPFYKARLADAYLMKREPNREGQVEALPSQEMPTVSAAGRREAPEHERVKPELVLCATANVSDLHLVPAGRRSTAFVFSGSKTGLSDRTLPGGGWLEAGAYEHGNRRGNSLASAMAISGAALAPSAGRETVNVRPYRLLMTLANIRLGVWLKNPYWVRPAVPEGDRLGATVTALSDFVTFPGPGMILYEGLGLASLYAPFLYVTDGGHLDNLGLVEALRRDPPPERVYVLDASADPEDTFITLAQAIATARMDLGVQIAPFELRDLTRGGEPAVKQAWASATATHRGGGTTEIVYIKALFMAGLSTDLDGYHAKHPSFPQTSTTNQLYDEFALEAFRELGWQLVDRSLPDQGKAGGAGSAAAQEGQNGQYAAVEVPVLGVERELAEQRRDMGLDGAGG